MHLQKKIREDYGLKISFTIVKRTFIINNIAAILITNLCYWIAIFIII